MSDRQHETRDVFRNVAAHEIKKGRGQSEFRIENFESLREGVLRFRPLFLISYSLRSLGDAGFGYARTRDWVP